MRGSFTDRLLPGKSGSLYPSISIMASRIIGNDPSVMGMMVDTISRSPNFSGKTERGFLSAFGVFHATRTDQNSVMG